MTISPFTRPNALPGHEYGLPKKRIGDILIDQGAAHPGDVLRALMIQRQENAKLGEIMRARGFTTDAALKAALQMQYYMPILNLRCRKIDPRVVALLPTQSCIDLGCVAIAQTRDEIDIALCDPSLKAKIDHLCTRFGFTARFFIAEAQQIQEVIGRSTQVELASKARNFCPDWLSCRTLLTRRNALLLFTTLVFSIGALTWANLISIALVAWISLALVANTTFKFLAMTTYILSKKPDYDRAPQSPKGRLPKVSLLVPLYKEHEIAERLVARMAQLDYPKELLEICLVCEADDTKTLAHLEAVTLPFWMRIIRVPPDTLRTKPRALNYALDFCEGDIVGIYDAEDAPQPDQIYKVVHKFETSPDDVACVQATLDYYNARSNWLSRCFTIEYAILFRVILQALEKWRLPIPLGGTSVFFRRDILEALGRWDAHNVTEDADLGMRLARRGYRCVNVASVTYEEANDRVGPWIKQRSRWLKGFLLTWAVHIRHPFQLLRDLGLTGFLVFNILFLGTVSAFAMTPLVLPLWLFTFGMDIPIYSQVLGGYLPWLILGFITTEIILFILGFTATRHRSLRHLTKFLPTMILYWPIGALAAYKALWEIMTRPCYWDKTQHGINDHIYKPETTKLTLPSPAMSNW